MKKAIGLILVVCFVSALVIAETSGEKETPQRRHGDSRTQAGRRGDPRNRQQAYQQMLERRKESHQKAIAELEAIKKIAEDEGASKTVEAIQKLIDQKNAEFEKRVGQFETQRRERSRQLQERTGGRPQRNPEPKAPQED